MKNRLLCVIATTIFMIGFLAGCKSLSPAESTQSAANETRTLINENVSDKAKAEKLISLIDMLYDDIKAFDEKQAAHNKALVKKNTDFDASREDLQKLYDAYNNDTRAIAKKIANTHLEMAKLTTPEEWALISKPKHRIGGY